MSWDAPPGVCTVCGQPVTRVADAVTDEWRWAGPDGPMPDLAHLPEPAAALNDLAERMRASGYKDHRAAQAGWR